MIDIFGMYIIGNSQPAAQLQFPQGPLAVAVCPSVTVRNFMSSVDAALCAASVKITPKTPSVQAAPFVITIDAAPNPAIV